MADHITQWERYEFIGGYIEAILWANTYAEADDGSLEPVDAARYSCALPEEMTDEVIEALEQDCFDFLTPQVVRLIGGAMRRGSRYQTYGFAGAGHDFALTRNGHGAGFWDRGFGLVGDALTKIAEPYGSRSLYVDADGVLQILE